MNTSLHQGFDAVFVREDEEFGMEDFMGKGPVESDFGAMVVEDWVARWWEDK